MRSFVVIIGLVALAFGGSYLYFQKHPQEWPIEWDIKQFKELKKKVEEVAVDAKQRFPTASTDDKKDKLPPSEVSSAAVRSTAKGSKPNGNSSSDKIRDYSKEVTVYLKNGGVIVGELARETPQEVILRFDYGDVGFQRTEIQRVVKGSQATEGKDLVMPWEGEHKKVHWPYQNDVVVKLNKGSVVDAKITSVNPKAIIMAQTLTGGGGIEHTIARADIDQLLFRPIRNKRSDEIEQNLQTVFPEFQWYKEGMCTIVTDSIPPNVKDYRRTVRELGTDFYL